MKEFLSKNSVNYIDMDITENLLFLKKFLKYRDNNAAFNKIKEKGSIGIPCIVVNEGEKFFFDQDISVLDQLKDQNE